MKRISTIYYTLLLVTIAISPLAKAQQQATVSDTSRLTVKSFLAYLEKQSGNRFFFDETSFDTTKYAINTKGVSWKEALKTGAEMMGFQYAVDPYNRVFISKNRLVITTLPSPVSSAEAAKSIVINDEFNADGKPDSALLTQSAVENKLYVVGDHSQRNAAGPAVLTGYIKDAQTGEPIVGASLLVENSTGVATDQYGYFALTIPRGQHAITIESIGMHDTKRKVLLYSDGKLDIQMHQEVMTLKNVVISSQKMSNVRNTLMGVQKLDIKTIKQVPVVFGEADLLKVMQLLPGVKSVGEASTGLNVRGGSADQNLILFNDATIFNPSHFFGMFSAFNPEVVKDVELYKSSIPARYGGRLSSVMDINSREGNKKDYTGSAGIGMLTARANVEGPLIKDKASFIVGGRTTYANWLLSKLPEEYRNSQASFYDVNVNVHYEIDKDHVLYLTGYKSNDKFNLNSDTSFGYGNQNLALKYKQIFNSKLNATISTGIDDYEFNVTSDFNPVNAYKLSSAIRQEYMKLNFTNYLSTRHTLDFGLNILHYKLKPGTMEPYGDSSIVRQDVVAAEQAMETAVYISDKFTISKQFSIEAGLRQSLYNYLGPQDVDFYADDAPRTENTITETKSYGSWKNIKSYTGPEIRLGMRYAFNDNFSVKAGINTQRQYIHTLTNTMAIAPTDIRKLSDPNIKPQYGEQASVGLYKNLKSNTIEISLEAYYKRIKHFLDYKSGAKLLMNHYPETEAINTRGKAYGVEFLVKKLTGKLNGWIGYTYSRTFLQQDDTRAGELINGGAWYPANYDMPHDATLVANYRFSHRFSLSMNATYNTGRPITPPVGTFFYSGAVRTLYADRNSLRIPDYFRADFSMNLEGNHKLSQWLHNSWTFGVYNLTGRKNAYSVYFITEDGTVNGYKLSIFGSIIPYINLNIRF